MKTRWLRNIFVFALISFVSGGCIFSSWSTFEELDQALTGPPDAMKIHLPERPETLLDIQTLLQDQKGDCQLPCWWGVRPGTTTEEEVTEFLQPVGIGSNSPELIYVFKDPLTANPLLYLEFSIKENLVTYTVMVIHNSAEWLPSKTLELPYLLSSTLSLSQATISISLAQGRIYMVLAYEEGILIQYAFETVIEGNVISRDVDVPFQLCPTLEHTSDIVLHLNDMDVQSLLKYYSTPPDQDNRVWSIEHMTGMTVEEFVKQIVEHPEECIELPSYPDLLEMGYEF